MDELTLADYFSVLRRWKKVFLAVFLTLLCITSFVALRWSVYRSTAVIQIEQPEISASATTPVGTNPNEQIKAAADQRISTLQQKVLSTGSLIEVITKLDLYSGARKSAPIAAIAGMMRKKIKVELANNTLMGGSAGKDQLYGVAFNVSFDNDSPLVAQQVTDELVTRFLDEDLKEQRTQTQGTAAFLGAQITDLEASLAEQDKKIADYQNAHGLVRPESLALNQQIAESLSLNEQNLTTQITTNEGTIGSIQAQLAGLDPYSRLVSDGQVLTTPSVQLKALKTQYASLTAQYGPEHPDVIKVRHQIEALQSQVGHLSKNSNQLKAQIADVRTNLDVATKTYGPDHPDVIALQSELQKLEDQLANSKTGSSGTDDGLVSDADNPAYLQVVAQLRSAEDQHKALLTQREELNARQEKYQSAINQSPDAAKELALLTRDYENAQLRYRELKEKKMAADMEDQMQKDRKGQRLTLVDPPELPLGPHPARIILLAGAILFSLMAGLFSVIFAQALSQSVVGPRHLESLVGVAPLVVIPHIFTKQEIAHNPQRKINTIWAMFTQRSGQ